MNNEWINKDYYKALGVPKDADAATIKKAYRKLARENHPDSKPGDKAAEERFKAVAEAYDVVGDAKKRKEYDEFREAAGSGFGPFQGGGFPGGFTATTQGFDVSDLFGGLFGNVRQQTRRPPQRGADYETSTTISFEDAINGTTVSLRLASDEACATCHGTGGKPGTRPHVCPTCDGAGQVARSMGGFSVNEPCPTCHGRQLVYDEVCPTCRGSGHGVSEHVIQTRIPAGVEDGKRVRLRGKGGPGENGGPAGDLFVTVHVSKHPIFGRKGTSLTVDVPVAFDEAVLGGEIKVPTLGGPPVTLRVQPGTPSGRVMRVRGRGVKRPDGTSGDLLVTVVVDVPKSLSDEERAAVETLRAARQGTPRDAVLGGL